MRIRLSLALAAVLALPALSPAWAQTPPLPDAPDKLPRASRGDRTKNLDFLFEALKAGTPVLNFDRGVLNMLGPDGKTLALLPKD